jgi:hypothetical protein
VESLATDILIVGGGVGGVAAALAVARLGGTCVLVEPTSMLGGQFTTQGVPPDENRWVEGEGSSRSYAAFREGVRAWCRANYALTPEARANTRLNPGGGWVSHLCFEPRIAAEVIAGMLGPHIASGRVRVLTGFAPTAADSSGDVVRGVAFRREDGEVLTVSARLVLDATETGDLYPLAAVEHMTGSECREQFNELHALSRGEIAGKALKPEGAIEEPGRVNAGGDPYDQQACSWCFAIEHHPGEDHTIPRPAAYEFWRAYVPPMRDVAWTGPLLSWTVPSHNTAGRRTFPFIPCPDECDASLWDMWRYRRIVEAAIHDRSDARARGVTDVCLVNWVQMDYWLRPLLGVDAAARATAEAEARELSLSLLYWMQTEAPRWDATGKLTGELGYPGLKLAGGPLGTADGLALRPYIREPRRLLARTVLTEGHIGVEQRELDQQHSTLPAERRPRLFTMLPTGKQPLAEPFEDSVGIGHYTLDLHPSTALRNSVYVPAAPFRIPLGALVPVRVRNLIASGKGIGVTHIANGCTRMHQVEWSIGEAAGTLAAYCVQRGLEPAQVHASLERTQELQSVLRAEGVPLRWSWE